MTPPDVDRAFRFRDHVWDLLRLATPVVLARSGVIILTVADTIMVGRHDSTELAYFGIAMAVLMVLIVSSIGLLMGTLVLTAAANGAGRLADCGAIWRRTLPYALAIGLTGATLCAFGEALLGLVGQSADLVDGGGPVLRILGFGMPGFLVFIASTFFLEGIRRPVPGMLIMLGANITNIALNAILIYGHLGLPAMGAEGAAIASTIVRTGIAVAIILYILRMPNREHYAVRGRPWGSWKAGAQQRRIGYAAGAAIGAESLAFGVVNLFAGLLGPLSIAAYSIAFNVFVMVFMVAIGLGAATAVRVGAAWGRDDRPGRDAAGWSGLAVNTAAMGTAAVVFAAIPATIVSAYTSDPTVAALATTLLAFCAWILIFDGGQAVMANALRGRGETWATTGLQTFSYFGIMIPLSWVLAFPGGRGAMGLFEGMLIASIVSMALLCGRFHWLSLRDRRAAAVSAGASVE